MTRVHVSLQTPDLAATTAFYAALFGVGPDKTRDGYARFQPTEVPITLSLAPGEPTPGAHHYGLKFATPEAMQRAADRLAATGLVRSTEAAVTCCHAVQDKVWLADPDGRAWEVYVVTDDQAPVAVDPGSTCCAVADPTSRGCCA